MASMGAVLPLDEPFPVADYGAVGDGVTDDAPAIRKAVEAAIEFGPNAKVVFERKTYRLGETEGGGAQIVLDGVRGLTLDGNGAFLLNTPTNGVFSLNDCRDVAIRGFVIDYEPMPYTQGTICAVDAEAGSFDLQIQDGYPLPPPDEWAKQNRPGDTWRWGTIIDPQERHRRWDVVAHYFIASVNPVEGTERTFRIQTTPNSARQVAPLLVGDRFFMPLCPGSDEFRKSTTGNNISVRGSSDCLLKDITIYGARNGMNFAIARNEGRITLNGIKIGFRPGSDRLVSTWKDGMHCKDNRVGPTIEECYFEGMLDDSINISANTAMAREAISDTEFKLVGPAFGVGDDVMVFDPVSGEIVVETTVASTEPSRGGAHVVLKDPAPGVVTGTKRPHKDIRSTHFYNMSYINRGFVVRECVFKPQRRHAMLIRGCYGVIKGNIVDSVGGAAVQMGNEMGSFYEGPFPHHNKIVENIFSDTQTTTINVYTKTLNREGVSHTRNIDILENKIKTLPGVEAIVVRNAARVRNFGNAIDKRGLARLPIPVGD